MRKLFLLILLIFLISGCAIVKETEEKGEDSYQSAITLNDGRKIYATFDVKYKSDSLMTLLRNQEITIDEFIQKLTFVDTVKDGGSKLYKYTDDLAFSGLNSFYVLSCNSLDNIKDIFITKNKDDLNNLCIRSYDDLENVRMEVKEDSVTNKGLKVQIKDTSDRGNIYDVSYFIQRYENDIFKDLTPKEDMVFTTQAYYPNHDGLLEFDINWSLYYGKLKKGKYRVVKSTNAKDEMREHYLTAEFDIK